jgi:hypothetical protein
MADDSENGHYRKVYTRIWEDPRFVALAPAEKLVALYLLTCPQSNGAGLYQLSLAMAGEEHLRMDRGELAKAIETVSKAFGWGFDESSRTVYLTTWWKYNQPVNLNVVKGAVSQAKKVPEGPLKERFMNNREHMSENLSKWFDKSFAKPFGNQQQQQQQEQHQEQEQEQQQQELPLAKAGAAAEVRRLTMVRELELCGVDAAKRVGLAGQLIRRGATPIVVRRMWRESQRMANRNPTGYLLSKLGDANGDGPSLAPGPTDLAKVVAAVERGEVVAIFGYPVRPGWVTHHAERKQIAIYDRPADGGTAVNAFAAGELTDWVLTLSGHALPAKE